jgi:hypothetical protein
MEVIPTVERRSDGVEVSADMTGGQLSVSTPVMPPQQPTFVPTIAIPPVEPTIVPVEMQPTADLTPATVPIVEPTTAPPEVQPTLAEAMTPAMDPTVEPSPVLALAQITGTISTPQAATLVLTLPDGTSVSATTAADGTFAFANLAAGDYRLEAQAEGFLSSQIEFTLTDGEALTLPPAVLRAGDTNRDNIIDVSDAVLIAANFGGPAISPEADLNRDGMIDIRDLTILGAVFGQSGPTSWE